MTASGARPEPIDEDVSAALRVAGAQADRRDLPLYLVGGAVRDLLLGRLVRDVDFAVEAGAANVLAFAQRLGVEPGWELSARHPAFGTASLMAPGGIQVDLATTRKEAYPRPASLPVIVGPATIDEDLGRRDFTINAMARSVGTDGGLGPLIDPFSGREDLQGGTLRLLHETSLVDDPTRALRAVKYAVRFGFRMERAFSRRLARAREAGAFAALTGDRFRRGIEEVLTEKNADDSVRLLVHYRLLDDVLPGWSERGIASKEMAAVESVESRWAALLRSLSPEERRQVAKRLLFSRKLGRAAGVSLR
jgi:tRNA nucleotidyltransferase (CCA-adding enzyme)